MTQNRLTRPDVQPIIERLGRITDDGWLFSDISLMALVSEIEDAVIAKQKPQPSPTNDASPVASTDEIRMRTDMHNAPLGKKLLLINEGGVLVPGTLTRDTIKHFIEWQYCPKRAEKQA